MILRESFEGDLNEDITKILRTSESSSERMADAPSDRRDASYTLNIFSTNMRSTNTYTEIAYLLISLRTEGGPDPSIHQN